MLWKQPVPKFCINLSHIQGFEHLTALCHVSEVLEKKAANALEESND